MTDNSSFEVPQHIEAEEAFLGAAMIDAGVIHDYADLLKPFHFMLLKHGIIWETLIEVWRKHPQMLEADPIALVTALENKNRDDRTGDNALKQIGGAAVLTNLMNKSVGVLNAPVYYDLITEAYRRRALLALSGEIAQRALTPTLDPADAVSVSIRDLETLAQSDTDRDQIADETPYAELVSEDYRILEERYSSDGRAVGIKTGFTDLDTLIPNGFEPGQSILIPGRPGMGKTALMLSLTVNQLRAGTRVGFISLEMSSREITARVQTQLSGVHGAKVKSANLNDNDWHKYASAAGIASELPFELRSRSQLRLWSQFKREAKRLRNVYGIEILYYDYIGLLDPDHLPSKVRYSEYDAQTQLSKEIKALAKELAIPVVGGVQLSRKTEDRKDHKPDLADLRSSGALEQDADIIIFPFREKYYDELAGDKAELLLRKQRNGPTGTALTSYDGPTMRFAYKDTITVQLNPVQVPALRGGDHG